MAARYRPSSPDVFAAFISLLQLSYFPLIIGLSINFSIFLELNLPKLPVSQAYFYRQPSKRISPFENLPEKILFQTLFSIF